MFFFWYVRRSKVITTLFVSYVYFLRPHSTESETVSMANDVPVAKWLLEKKFKTLIL